MNVGWGKTQLTRYTTDTGRISINFCASKLLASSFTCWREKAVSSNTEGSQISEQFLPFFYGGLRMAWLFSRSFSMVPCDYQESSAKNMWLIACTPPSPKLHISWPSPLPLWSNFSKLSEMLSPKLHLALISSPKKRNLQLSHCSFISRYSEQKEKGIGVRQLRN